VDLGIRRRREPVAAYVRDVATVKATFDRAERYLKDNSSIPVRAHLIQDLTRTVPFDRYIEIGCGDGTIGLSLLASGKQLTLFDLSEQMIAAAKANTPTAAADRVTYVVGDAHDFAPDRPFDLLICVGVIAHVQSVQELLTTIASFVGEHGYMVLQFTDSRSLGGRLIARFADKAIGGYEMSKTCYGDLVPLLANLGFAPVERVSYSEFSFGLRRLSQRAAVCFKLFTSWLRMPYVFSESIVLFRRVS
jgi:ubiquinone/menaquinone biosynthesis C-methylase UbiE